MKLKKVLWNLVVILSVVYVGVLVHKTVSQYQKFKVNGPSMEPTLHNGDKLTMKQFTDKDVLKRGDVVIIKVKMNGENDNFIKRVIALPGEHLEIKDHKIYINGKYLEDEGAEVGKEDIVIPKDSVYVMGDNRGNSTDSRQLGTMKISNIIAKKDISRKE